MKKPICILHLEDDAMDAELVQAKLESTDLLCDITRVQTRVEYSDALQRGGYDVILADYNLPDYDGVSALRLAQELCPNVPFVFVSGVIGEDAAIDGLLEGATDYVLKQKLARLVPAVKRALHEAENRRERKRAQVELEQSRQQLRELATHLQSAREAERAAIAREIHDELGQLLTGLKFDLFWLKRNLKPSTKPIPRRAVTKITSMIKLVEDTISSVRSIAAKLRPAVLDELGLDAAIEWQIKEFTQQTGIRCVLDSTSQTPPLAIEQTTALFRILQEALTNIARHANATHVLVTLKIEAGKLRLEIQDNGKGIAEKKLTKVQSLGIVGMKERVLLLGGEIKITGVPRKGTTVAVEIPIEHPVHLLDKTLDSYQ